MAAVLFNLEHPENVRFDVGLFVAGPKDLLINYKKIISW